MFALQSATTVNDVHSRLNATRVAGVAQPRDIDELRSAIRHAADRRLGICICGGRHAMGGQQFGTDTLLIDTSSLNRSLRFDNENGLIEMEAGASWPAVIAATHQMQGASVRRGIRQKQTGADAMSLGGAASANVHGRGLLMRPFADDIESLVLILADGEIVTCSRDRNSQLFSLAVGGYGLFGVIASITLRLGPRLKLRRLVDILDIDDAISAVRRRVSEGCVYGDFQYAIDPADDSFLRRGVCACYKPAEAHVLVSDDSADLKRDDWIHLLKLAHSDKRRAFDLYSAHYLRTHGQTYWSDTMQLSMYVPTYDQFIKETSDQRVDESLMIGELYVPPMRLPDFLHRARAILREGNVEDIYGTIRSIRRDDTTFLPWARDDYACVIFNLRTLHTAEGIARTAGAFRALHDGAIDLSGSFYLTYHRFATRKQLEACYPQLPEFLKLKRKYDPHNRFTSDWYRYVKETFE